MEPIKKENCIQLYFEDNEQVWRYSNVYEKMVEYDNKILNNISKRIKLLVVCPTISVAIQLLQPMPSQASVKSPSAVVKIQERKNGLVIHEKTKSTDSSNNFGSLYIDKLDGNMYTQKYHTIDFRTTPIKIADKRVLLKPVSAKKLYQALAFLDQKGVLSAKQVEIQKILRYNGISVDNFNLLCKFNPKTGVFKLRAGQSQGQGQQIEQPSIENNMQKVRYGRILTNVLLVILSALLLGIIVTNVIDILGEDSDPIKYTFNKSMFQYFMNLKHMEIGHIGYITKLMGDFCANYPRIELAPTEAINRMCQDYLLHFEVAIKIKGDITKLVGRNPSLSETINEAKRVGQAYMVKYIENHK